ncbi:MAG: hypothetical protein BWX85_00592 [Chloroflexi bacterium ADurb.Bin120]|nr:MAG: hypothetical protein BWX85_00592 [Chloroflexi bacterium ADurb.Bin120]
MGRRSISYELIMLNQSKRRGAATEKINSTTAKCHVSYKLAVSHFKWVIGDYIKSSSVCCGVVVFEATGINKDATVLHQNGSAYTASG